MNKVKLGELLRVKRGKSLPGKFYATTGSLIRLTLGNFDYPDGGFKKNTSKSDLFYLGPVESEFILKKGDLITPLTEQVAGLLGEVAVIPESDLYIQSGDVGLLVPFVDKLDSNFARYLVASCYVKKQLGQAAQQTKIRHTSPEAIENCLVWAPALDEQKYIGRLLAEIDDKIELNKRMMRELEDTARLIYDYWFTQFDFPDENGKPYRSSGGKMVYSKTLKREIPEGWEAGLMSDLGSVVSGATPSTGDSSNYADEGIAWITPNDLSDNDSFMHISHGKRDVSGVGLASCSAVMMPAGSTIMSSRAPIGYLAVAETACCTNQGCKSLVADAGYPSYFNFFTVQRLMPFIKSQGAGTTFAEVSKEDFASVRLAKPPKGMAERFEKIVLPLCENSKRLQQEAAELSSLRDWLLPMLMNGQVSISG